MVDFHDFSPFVVAAVMGSDDTVAAGDLDVPGISVQSQFAKAIFNRHRIPVTVEIHQTQMTGLHRPAHAALMRESRQRSKLRLFHLPRLPDGHLLTGHQAFVILQQAHQQYPVQFLK